MSRKKKKKKRKEKKFLISILELKNKLDFALFHALSHHWSILVRNIFLYQSPLQKEKESTFCRNYRKKGSFRWILWTQNTLIRAYSQMLVSSPISYHYSHLFFISFSNYIIEPNISTFSNIFLFNDTAKHFKVLN